MDTRQQARLARIEAFEFDEPGTRLTFAARLARENSWSVAHAKLVLREYKRFCFLAMEAGHPATPSEDVDQAWHLHLVYTRSYWGDFCPNALGQPLHHGPTKGGEAEGAKHDDWYRRTLASYERLFGDPPLVDIWPASKERFSRDLAWRRVNWRDNWIVPKRPVRTAVAAGVLTAAVVGCNPQGDDNPLNWKGPEFLALYFFLFVAVVVFNLIVRFILTRTLAEADRTPKLSPYDLAYLHGQKPRLFLTVTADLARRGHLKPNAAKTAFQPDLPLEGKATALEREVFAAHEAAMDLRRAAKQPLAEEAPLRERLLDEKLIVPDGRAKAIAWMNALPLLALLLFGLAKINVGVDRGKPVTILIVGCVVTFFVMLAFTIKPFLTGVGKRVMRTRRSEHRDLIRSKSNLAGTDVALAMALFGVAALEAGAFAELHAMMRRIPGGTNATASSGGCTSGASGCSSGGSDGGGGGGGCGGCGGGGGGD